jgi:hypothetical protein
VKEIDDEDIHFENWENSGGMEINLDVSPQKEQDEVPDSIKKVQLINLK